MGKKGRNPYAQAIRNVSEAARIRISQLLKQFCASDDQVYTFEDKLSKYERALVHQLSRKRGMKTKSRGGKNQRRVSVCKMPKKEADNLTKEKEADNLTTEKKADNLTIEKKADNLTKEKKKKKADNLTKEKEADNLTIEKEADNLTIEKEADNLTKEKKKKKADNLTKKKKKKKADVTCLTFSEQSRLVLQDLFANYPPEDGEHGEKVFGIHDGSDSKRQGGNDDLFSRPSMTKEDIENKVKELNTRIEKTAKLRQIAQDRSKLPIASFKDIITSAVDSCQVVLISGETGCGKTTQVPQFLLDHMWGRGAACKIVCAQPRRMSATSVADRIACERGETIGNDIGYKIRLESRGGRNTSIVFCTNGVFLRVLISKGTTKSKGEASRTAREDDLSSITHIIVDEIHERDRYSDFMLTIIRDILPSYPRLRLVLMSATLDAERFSKYFGGCPVICVPGFTYPVKSFYLEDVLSIVNSEDNGHSNSVVETKKICELTEEDRATLDEAINLAWTGDEFDSLLDLVSSEGIPDIYNYQDSLVGLTPLMVFAGKGRVHDVCMLLSFGADCHLRDKDGLTALQWAEQQNHQEAAVAIRRHVESSMNDSLKQKLLDDYLAKTDPNNIDTALIEKLLRKICTDSAAGAILVFLPGWDYIAKTQDRLLANPYFSDSSKFVIISLHSMVPPEEQKKVFQCPPQGCRKIILSTNIAETAITIDDVVYVIDSGRMKEKSYDPYSNVFTLQSSWVSKANSKQRAGRAGRCQPGICYHLYSKVKAESFPDYQVPEMKRTPIEELCLQVKLLDPECKIADFLQKTMDPPVLETMSNAIAVLQDIGALSQDEQLTQLGEKLGRLPVHPSTSKMLFVAILMNCLDPALTIACASYYRDPFILPMRPDEKLRAADAKLELASLYGGNSDQLAVIAAFQCWKNAKVMGQEAQFCSQYFISSGTMHMLDGMRKKLKSELIRCGFIQKDVSCCNLNSHVPGIINAVLVAGMYPLVGKILPSNGKKRIIVQTANGAKARLHPHSLISKVSSKASDHCPPIMYDEIVRGDAGVLVRNCTVAGPLPILLLAKEIVVAPGENEDDDDKCKDENGEDDEAIEMEIDEKLDGHHEEKKIMSSPDKLVRVVVDRWLYFRSRALDVAQIYCLRERLIAAILFKVTHPQEELPSVLGASMYTIASILAWDGKSGRSGIPPSSESVNSIGPMVHPTGIDNSGPEREGNGPILSLESLLYAVQPTAAASGSCKPQFRAFEQKSKGKGKKGKEKKTCCGNGGMTSQILDQSFRNDVQPTTTAHGSGKPQFCASEGKSKEKGKKASHGNGGMTNQILNQSLMNDVKPTTAAAFVVRTPEFFGYKGKLKKVFGKKARNDNGGMNQILSQSLESLVYGVQPMTAASGFRIPQFRASRGESKGSGNQDNGGITNQRAPMQVWVSLDNSSGIHGTSAGSKRKR